MGGNYGIRHMVPAIYLAYGSSTFGHMQTMGSRLRALRKEQGFNQEALALAVGVDQSTISDMENDRGLGADKLMRLCEVLSTTAEYLMNGADSDTAAKDAAHIQALIYAMNPAVRLAAMASIEAMAARAPTTEAKPGKLELKFTERPTRAKSLVKRSVRAPEKTRLPQKR